MSLDEFRRMKLFKRLQDNLSRVCSKSEAKTRLPSNWSVTENLRRINKNKKYMLEEERNTEIERDNRMLYEKIMNHFKDLNQRKQMVKNINKRNRWRNRKHKKIDLGNSEQLNSSVSRTEGLTRNFGNFPRTNTVRSNRKEESAQTLFLGEGQIDDIALRVKILLTGESYYLLAHNKELSIQLQMARKEYMNIHNRELRGDPRNIFKYLQISNQQVKFREKVQPARIPKLKTAA